tara:strand:+ start:504 stop:695 length:192 start_codon:yes stop_codon:yes gene_type:complete
MAKRYETSMGTFKNSKSELQGLSRKKLIELFAEEPGLTVIQELLNSYKKGGMVEKPMGPGGKK